jgi:hypothetical protein
MIALILVIALMPIGAGAAEISIKPGKFSHFNLIAPDNVIAGETANIQLQAVDAFNNVIPDFNMQQTEFRIVTTGNATPSQTTFRASAFTNGIFQFTIRDTAAETVTVSVFESVSSIPLVTRELRVAPANIHSLRIASPRTVGAGEKFTLKITAIDNFGNLVTTPIPGKNLNILFKGDTEPRIVDQNIPDFIGGVCSLALMAEKVGTFVVEAKDLVTSVSGTSEKIEITNGALSSFQLVTPRESVAGEPFDVAIVALDAFSNVVKNYSSIGSGVMLSATGSAKPFPSTILAYEFQNGQARVQIRYDVPEDIQLIAQDLGRKITSKSDVIHVVKAVPSRYEVVTPETAIAGQRFKLKVTAYNQKGSVIRNYNLSGPDVLLITTGTGKLTPSRIPASEFINGTAVINAQYNKSESFTITAVAAEDSDREKTRPTVSGKKRVEKSKKHTIVSKGETAAAKKGKKSSKSSKKAGLTAELIGVSISEQGRPKLTITLAHAEQVRPYISVVRRDGKQWLVVKLPSTNNALSVPVRLDSSWIGDVQVDDDAKLKGVVIRFEMLQNARPQMTKDKNFITIILK